MLLLDRDDAGYPAALRKLPDPPTRLTTTGPLERGRAVVAIVGSRAPVPEAARFARELAFDLARAGVTVVSGGAKGIDGAAHRGALDAGGATWVVSPAGSNRVAPSCHRELFDEVARSPRSRMIWPFPDDYRPTPFSFRRRNGVLVALADAVVVVQAFLSSGSRNAAAWARELRRTLWVVPAAPWMKPFEGSLLELASGARPLWTKAALFASLEVERSATDEVEAAAELQQGLFPSSSRPPERRGQRRKRRLDRALAAALSTEEKAVISALSDRPSHVESVAAGALLPVSSTVTALLTLALKDVVVEGPDGFFRLNHER